jgi:hypothetical protein
VDLDGVEFKSLPSGLHAVKEDLIYFVHGKYAGISVFVQGEADAKQRNASFVAVGVLVPLSQGQLGRSWLHAEELRTLVKEVVKDTTDTRHLELFWKKHRADETAATSSKPAAIPASPTSDNRKRKRTGSESTFASLKADKMWPTDHPALAIPLLVDSFGPLIFPLHRAALLRKRVLFLGSTPVQNNCNAVYNTSVLSAIPQALFETLPPSTQSIFQCRPLFSVGIQEMPVLTSHKGEKAGWIACTTDDILGEKKDLYDFIVELPGTSRSKGLWPTLKTSEGDIIKASQRDLRRWRQLRNELKRLKSLSDGAYTDEPEGEPTDNDEQPLIQPAKTEEDPEAAPPPSRDENDVIEPSSWAALAYRGFIWWASAGEASAFENEQAQADEQLLLDLPDVAGILESAEDDFDGDDNDEIARRNHRNLYFSRAAATVVVAYFRRVTENLLKTMTAVVEEADDETEEGIAEDAITVELDAVREMGLDTWSATDKAFVVEMMRVWYDRDAVVTGGGVRLCGLRIC